jgi:hypothetical protein
MLTQVCQKNNHVCKECVEVFWAARTNAQREFLSTATIAWIEDNKDNITPHTEFLVRDAAQDISYECDDLPGFTHWAQEKSSKPCFDNINSFDLQNVEKKGNGKPKKIQSTSTSEKPCNGPIAPTITTKGSSAIEATAMVLSPVRTARDVEAVISSSIAVVPNVHMVLSPERNNIPGGEASFSSPISSGSVHYVA